MNHLNKKIISRNRSHVNKRVTSTFTGARFVFPKMDVIKPRVVKKEEKDEEKTQLI